MNDLTLHLELKESNKEKLLSHLGWLKEIGLIEQFNLEGLAVKGKGKRGKQNGSSHREKLIGYVHQQLGGLKDNWDGYGGSSILPVVRERTENLLQFIPTEFLEILDEDAILPNPNGTISIVWNGKQGNEVFLEIGSSFGTYYCKQNGNIVQANNQFELNKPQAMAELAGVLSKLFT